MFCPHPVNGFSKCVALGLLLCSAIFGASCRKKLSQPPAPQYPPPITASSEKPPQEKPSQPKGSQGQPPARDIEHPPPRIAIIIDDFGYNDETAKAFLKLPFPIALSVLPRLQFSEWISREAKKSGKPVLLHLPLEALKDNAYLGPGALFTNMEDRDLEQTFVLDLATVPDAEGVNNHMGSKGSQDPRVARWVAKEAKEHHLYVIDSLTAPNSILFQEARKLGIRAEKREIFLDNVIGEEAISAQFDELLKAAREKGKAIAIGHPHPETLKVLHERLPKLESEKVQIVPVNELLDSDS